MDEDTIAFIDADILSEKADERYRINTKIQF